MKSYRGIQWLKQMTTSVLPNGVLGKPFKYKRGLDLLSPLLFVLGVDLLQSVINDAANNGLISHPLGSEFGGDFPINQYVDDI